MFFCLFLNFMILIPAINKVYATNHYILKDGYIKQKLDSPFYLREPENLHVFLEQIRNNENAEEAFRKIQQKRSILDTGLIMAAQLYQEIVEQSSCAKIYLKISGLTDYIRITGASMKRLKFPEIMDITAGEEAPKCKDFFELISGNDEYMHLINFDDDVRSIAIGREEDLLTNELGLEDAKSVTETIYDISRKGLKNHPSSWKYHMLGSYYWRLVGNAANALECGHISVILAPKESKDMPLLSLGTILVRAKLWNDAEKVLNEAIKYGPDHAENYIALATLLALRHDFKKARETFNLALAVDESMYNSTQRMRQYIECLEPLENNASRLFGYVKFMLREIEDVTNLRQEIKEYQNKIVRLQIPLASRYTDNNSQEKLDLIKRNQYCSTKKSNTNNELVLFCDFYTDLQMQLENKQFDVEILDWEVNRYIRNLFEHFPAEYKRQLDVLYNKVTAIPPVNAFI